MTNKIEVRTKAGRLARVSPHGEFIPTDRYVSVRMAPYIWRLLNVHGDIEVKPPKAAPKKPASSAETKTEKEG